MTESKSFNRTATVLLTVMVVFAMMPILLIVIASFSSESSLIRTDILICQKSGALMLTTTW